MGQYHFVRKDGLNNFFNNCITCIATTCDQFAKRTPAVIAPLSRASISPSLRGPGGALHRGAEREYPSNCTSIWAQLTGQVGRCLAIIAILLTEGRGIKAGTVQICTPDSLEPCTGCLRIHQITPGELCCAAAILRAIDCGLTAVMDE